MNGSAFIRLDRINKSYFNGYNVPKRKVLDDLDLVVRQGDTIAITGPSGTGKSTLLNIIGLIDLPDSGLLQLMGQETQGLQENALSHIRNQQIGYIFQQHHLFPQLTLFENIMLPLLEERDILKKRAAELRGMDWIAKVGLDGKERQFPWQLSGGELQRASVIRALINEPELILADEPTGSLDEENAQLLIELLQQINNEDDITLVMVTHAAEFAEKMNRHYRIKDGKLMEL